MIFQAFKDAPAQEQVGSAAAQVRSKLTEILAPAYRHTDISQNRTYAAMGEGEYRTVRANLINYLSSLPEYKKFLAASALAGDYGGQGWMEANMQIPLAGISGDYAATFLMVRQLAKNTVMGSLPSSEKQTQLINLNTISSNLEILRKLIYEGMDYVAPAWISQVGKMSVAAGKTYDNGPYFKENDCMTPMYKFWFRLYRNMLGPNHRETLGLNNMHYDQQARIWQPNVKYEYYAKNEIAQKWNAATDRYENHLLINFKDRTIQKWNPGTAKWEKYAQEADWSNSRARVWNAENGKWKMRVLEEPIMCYGRPLRFAMMVPDRQRDGLIPQVNAGRYNSVFSWEERKELQTGSHPNYPMVFSTELRASKKAILKIAAEGDMVFTEKSYLGTGNGHSGIIGQDSGGNIAVYNYNLTFSASSINEFFKKGGKKKKLYRKDGIYMRMKFGETAPAPTQYAESTMASVPVAASRAQRSVPKKAPAQRRGNSAPQPSVANEQTSTSKQGQKSKQQMQIENQRKIVRLMNERARIWKRAKDIEKQAKNEPNRKTLREIRREYGELEKRVLQINNELKILQNKDFSDASGILQQVPRRNDTA